jgi:type II secretory pathway pseudopilin PulG
MIFIAVIAVLVAAGVLALLALTRTSSGVDRSTETTARMERIADALERFASAAERLPCPADPAADTGDAVPNAPIATCTFPRGTVPWRTIGLRRDDAFDAWGWKVSYRVFSGPTGLTIAKGASMVDCDTVEPSPAGTNPDGTCKSTHDTTPAQFLAGKGLALNDFGTVVNDAAYILISHGATGLGGYTTSGTQKTPGPTSAEETANLADGPYVAKAAVTTGDPASATYFDDVLAYRHLADFARRANLAARNWPEAGGYADVTFNAATMNAAMGSTPAYGNLGTSTINVPGATVTGINNSGTNELTFDQSGGTEGIGGAGGTGGTLTAFSSENAEGVRVTLYTASQKLGVTLNDFGRHTGQPGNPREQVQFTFLNAGTTVFTVTKQGCKPDGDLATFTLDAGALYDTVEIRALPPTGARSRHSSSSRNSWPVPSSSPCQTSLATPGNSCP